MAGTPSAGTGGAPRPSTGGSAGAGSGGKSNNGTGGTAAGGSASGGEATAAGGSGGSAGGSGPLQGKPTEKALKELDAIRQEHSVVSLDGEGYMIGGYVANQVSESVLAYDPTTDTWRSVADFPAPMNHGNAGTVNGKIVVAGFYITGMSEATTQTFAYDAKANAWDELAPMPTGTQRAASCVAVDGAFMYVVGGAHQGMSRDTVTRYDATADSWETLPVLPERREHCAAGVIDGIVIVAGGRRDTITGVEPKTWAFDPQTMAWTEKASLDPARGGLAGAVLQNRLIVFGGEGNDDATSGVFPQIDAYDLATDSWELVGEMDVPRHGYGAALIGERIYLLGGATRQGGGAAADSSAFYFE